MPKSKIDADELIQRANRLLLKMKTEAVKNSDERRAREIEGEIVMRNFGALAFIGRTTR